ncbi:WD repeat-containing protein 54 isoform X2 [Pteropus medius]|uniref:WD repeat-containing protein 54 isoform X2 n=1 Tax=Pteropus vampyrus TaxID=132908 RepID=UPI00196A2305|nr:WD repeat-containing protein 54 isoform X2 [Pteropus giganteus]
MPVWWAGAGCRGAARWFPTPTLRAHSGVPPAKVKLTELSCAIASAVAPTSGFPRFRVQLLPPPNGRPSNHALRRAAAARPPPRAHSCPSNRAARCTFGLFAPPNGHAYVRRLYGGGGFGETERSWSQVHWCVLPFRVLLVLTSHRGIQMYESDGSVMVYWHALDAGDASPVQAVFARGIASSGHFICVGTWSGRVLVFDIPAKGPNIVLSEELAAHPTSVTDIASEPAQGQDCVADMVTADDSGLLCIWQSGPEFKLSTQIPGFGIPCTSVQLWQGTIAAGYGNGQVRLYEASTGNLHIQINAHARAICALDLAPEVGKLLTAAEDTFVHIWKLSRSPESGYIEVEHCHGECVPDTQVCGARFCDPSGNSFAVTGYDLAEILRFSSM